MITQISTLQSSTHWQLITHLGSSSLLMPIMVITVINLWLSNQKQVVYLWMVALGLAVTFTTITKVMFFGWGIGIALLDFTGVSGHTLLATSIYPILFYSAYGGTQTKYRNIGLWFGIVLSLLVGVSRIATGAHSISEVIPGWVLGMLVCALVLDAMNQQRQRLAYLQVMALICLLVFGSIMPNYIPTHDMEIELALFMSGRNEPYTRADLISTQILGQVKLQKIK
ncbi:phosphatase PAP2 family protein [Methylotenera sp.]|uniref:phosphatase PAP2 family protein n=1 Tax=Methylotenera sp. TaxID=2051956 RepID=UPI002487F079|nr:phosphatase PAP2 family protein [Methylotenera sp.]MDI1298681.1 phosphatase PAP2 family protein [Methylotenera sp.]